MAIENNNPMLNRDLKIHIVKSGIFLRNTNNKRTYHIGELEYKILSTFDGKHTIDELKEINAEYMNEKQFEEFVFYANANGLLERENKSPKGFDIFKIRKPLYCPMNFLHEGKLLNILKLFLIVGSLVSLAILAWFISSRATIIFQILFTNDYLQVVNILYYFASIFIIGFFHEMGHAIMIVASGGNVFEMGVMLNYFHPAFYVDITGVEQIKSKQSRILVWIAGIMSEIIIALPTMLLAFYEKSPLYLNEFLIIFNILNTSMMIFNLLFVIKLDGYYILSELLEMKGLREKSVDSVIKGYNSRKSGNVKTQDRLIFTIIGIISVVYLPLFLMQMVITGVNHFVPNIMSIVNKVMLVWIAVGIATITIRKIIVYIRS